MSSAYAEGVQLVASVPWVILPFCSIFELYTFKLSFTYVWLPINVSVKTGLAISFE